jgi:hypothetical protein
MSHGCARPPIKTTCANGRRWQRHGAGSGARYSATRRCMLRHIPTPRRPLFICNLACLRQQASSVAHNVVQFFICMSVLRL